MRHTLTVRRRTLKLVQRRLHRRRLPHRRLRHLRLAPPTLVLVRAVIAARVCMCACVRACRLDASPVHACALLAMMWHPALVGCCSVVSPTACMWRATTAPDDMGNMYAGIGEGGAAASGEGAGAGAGGEDEVDEGEDSDDQLKKGLRIITDTSGGDPEDGDGADGNGGEEGRSAPAKFGLGACVAASVPPCCVGCGDSVRVVHTTVGHLA